MATYPPYVTPDATGITWASGPFPLQQLPGQYLCTEADAQIVLKAFLADGVDAKLVNAALEPELQKRFSGLDPASPLQPWWIVTNPDGFGGAAGFAVGVMWGPNGVNGGGVGNPGHWKDIKIGRGTWVPEAPPAPPPPPPAVNMPGGSIWTGLSENWSANDRDVLNDIRRLVVALAAKQGIS